MAEEGLPSADREPTALPDSSKAEALNEGTESSEPATLEERESEARSGQARPEEASSPEPCPFDPMEEGPTEFFRPEDEKKNEP
jgi:hypothetical protein